VNLFFECYGRTFAFRNQTYLISYCVYTAATIELQEMRHGSRESADKAAKRLATTLSMLETEARQTPGVKRSVDIIRSQLDTRRPNDEQQPNRKRGRSQTKQVQEPGPSVRRYLSAQTSEDSSLNFSQFREDIREASTHTSPQRLESQADILENTATNTQEEFIQNTSSIDLNNVDLGGSQIYVNRPGNYSHANIDDDSWTSWNTYDPSGGFAPDMANWTWQDMVMYE